MMNVLHVCLRRKPEKLIPLHVVLGEVEVEVVEGSSIQKIGLDQEVLHL